MRTVLTILAILITFNCFAREVFTGEKHNDKFTIHGRLSCYNGGSTYRIWIVGSKRMLYVAGDPTPALDRVNKYFKVTDSWFKHDIFADFTVEPLSPDQKGHMRPVRILAINRVVIAKDGTMVTRKKAM